MSEYVSKYAACPYYHRHDDNRICCEGTEPRTTINIVFENSKRQKDYEIKHCNSIEGCKKCIVHQALNIKYGVLSEI